MRTNYEITIPVIADAFELVDSLLSALTTPGAHGIARVEPIAGHSGVTLVRQDDGSFTAEYHGDGDDVIFDAVAETLRACRLGKRTNQ